MSFDNRADGPAQSDSVRVVQFDKARAHDAWEAHRAMLLCEIRQPALKENPSRLALRETAMNDFLHAFGEVCR